VNGALSKEIKNGNKMSKNTGLSYGMIFFWRKMKWMGAIISGGDPCGAHKVMGRAQRVGCALHPCGPLVRLPGVFSTPKILKYYIKSQTKFTGHLENFSFWDIFYFMDNLENR